MNADFSEYSPSTRLARTISHNDCWCIWLCFLIKLGLKLTQPLGREVYEAIYWRVSTGLLRPYSVKVDIGSFAGSITYTIGQPSGSLFHSTIYVILQLFYLFGIPTPMLYEVIDRSCCSVLKEVPMRELQKSSSFISAAIRILNQ